MDWWLFGHELGHQYQTRDWTNNGITEVAVNLFRNQTAIADGRGRPDFRG
ncbi:M60 family metallopeptidase [Candidatus Palauibacter sp.]